MLGIQSIVKDLHPLFISEIRNTLLLLVMRITEIGNGDIDHQYNRKNLGSARPKFLPSTGLSYSSDSADTE
jgi:hypothetical protein